MAVFGLLKGVASREPVVNGCMVLYSKPIGFSVIFFLYQPSKALYLFLDFTCHVAPYPPSTPL